MATWLVLLLLTQTAAALLYTLVEHPAERFLRRIGPRPDVPELVPAATMATDARPVETPKEHGP